MGIKLKKKKVVCLVSYEPPFLNSEKLKAILCRYRKLLAFRFWGYFYSINSIKCRKGSNLLSHLERTFLTNFGNASEHERKNACVYNNTHSVTYFVTFLFVMKLYSVRVKFFQAEKSGGIYA